MIKAKKISKEPEYPLTKGEIKYKILMNPDKNKYDEISQKIRENNFFCISTKEKTPNTRCFCSDFLSLDKENIYCTCGRYFKQARTEEEVKKYIVKRKLVGKNEKKILQEKDKEETPDKSLLTEEEEDFN
jgi:hypothetical protein